MSLWIEDIAQYLEDSTTGIGIFSPTSTETRTIYCNNLPGSSASLIVLYPYAGIKPTFSNDRASIRAPRLNIAVYSTAADGGHQKSIDIRTRLDHAVSFGVPSSAPARSFQLIQALGEPEYLGRDDNGRGYFVTNYQVEYTS